MKKSQLSNLEEKKQMALKLFEFVEQFMMDTFLFKLTQFEKPIRNRKKFSLLKRSKELIEQAYAL